MRGPWNGSWFGHVGREPWALRVLWMGGDARLWLRPPGGRRGRRGRRKQASCCPKFESADAADRINPYCLRLHTRAPPPTRSNPDFSTFRPFDPSTLFPASRLADSPRSCLRNPLLRPLASGPTVHSLTLRILSHFPVPSPSPAFNPRYSSRSSFSRVPAFHCPSQPPGRHRSVVTLHS
jgi:hypothetical protein